eukprot:3503043-Prymnesium_polylepis.1
MRALLQCHACFEGRYASATLDRGRGKSRVSAMRTRPPSSRVASSFASRYVATVADVRVAAA